MEIQKIADTIEMIVVALMTIVGLVFIIGYISIGDDRMAIMVLTVLLIVLIQFMKEFWREYWG